jgi:tetratricopeptide (TPR) repeat protein
MPSPDVPDPSGEIRVAPTGTPMSPDQVQRSIADGFFAKGLFEMAAPEYEKYLGIYPGGSERPSVLFRLGESYRRMGSTNAAKTSYQALLDQYNIGEFIGPASYRLAEIYYSERNFSSALPYFRRASVRLTDPKLANAAKFFTARCLETLGQRLEARTVYEDLVLTQRDNPFLDNSRLSLAFLLRDANRTAEALKHAQAIAQSTQNPELKAQATVYSGMWLIDLGQNAKAEETLKRAIDMPNVERWRDAAQYGLIQLEFNSQKYQSVIDRWSADENQFTAEVKPQVMLVVAKAYRGLNKTAEAEALFDRILKEAPDSVPAREAGYERLVALYRGDSPDLVAAIDKFLNAAPDDKRKDQVLLMKAEALFKKQDFAAASALYDGLAKSRQLTGEMKAEALAKLAWCYQQTRKFDRAVTALTSLIESFPTYKTLSAIYLQRAVSWLRLNNQEAGIKDFRVLIEKFPKAKEREAAILQLARMLGQRGDNTGMVDTFKIYLRDYPDAETADRAEASFWIGSVAFENRSYKDAIAPLHTARELNKTDYFERASVRLMLCFYYLEDTEGVAKEIESYVSGGAKGQVPYEVLRWLGFTLFDRANNHQKAGKPDLSAENYRGAVKHLGMLMTREDAKAEDWKPFGKSALALKDYPNAEKAFTSLLASIKEPVPRAESFNDLAQAQLGAGKFREAQASVEQGLKLKPDGSVNAELRITAGDIQAAQEHWLDAAKTYESVSIIIDDENVTPRAGEKSVACYRRAGEEDVAKKLLNKLQSRYPEYFQNKRLN